MLERWGMKEIGITRKLKQNSMKAGQKAPFFSLTCPFLLSEEVLDLHTWVCVCLNVGGSGNQIVLYFQ